MSRRPRRTKPSRFALVLAKLAAVRQRILPLFEKVKTDYYEDVFDKADTLKLDDDSLAYVVGELQNYCVMDADRDAIGDAFEVFIGPALRGAEGRILYPAQRGSDDGGNPRPAAGRKNH